MAPSYDLPAPYTDMFSHYDLVARNYHLTGFIAVEDEAEAEDEVVEEAQEIADAAADADAIVEAEEAKPAKKAKAR